MSDVVHEFERVLENERLFALSADIDSLAAVQDEKRELLDKLREAGLPDSESQRLRELAFANVQLIRHLVACLQGLLTPEVATYTAGGERPVGAMSRSWGRL